MGEASKPLKLYLIREDGTRQELNTWSAEPVAQVLKRQLTLPKHLHSGVKILFGDNEVPHSHMFEEAGIENEAEIKVIGLVEALEAKAREEEQRRRKQLEKEAKEMERERKRREYETSRPRSYRSYGITPGDSYSSGRTRSYGSSRESAGARCGRGAGARG